jgi:hypothetical protein
VRPNSFTRRTPDTDSVSCIMPFISAFASIDVRRIARRRFPTWRDAMMKRGRIDTARIVSLHSRRSMITNVAPTANTFDTSVTKVDDTAC